MVGNKNIRDYEVSIWTLQDSFITVLKQFGLEHKGQIQEPNMVLKDDGQNTFSFNIPMWLYINGEYKENPIWFNTINGNIIANMRKIKVIFNKGTDDEKIFEFLIIKVTEKHEGYQKKCEVETEGLAFNELGKQGYKISLTQDDYLIDYEKWEEDGADPNTKPINNINYWCDKIFKNSNWHYSIQMDWTGYPNREIDKIYDDAYVKAWNPDTMSISEIQEEREKYRPMNVSESNRYNLTQSVAEEFQVFCKYIYSYDDNYHIVDREVIFYNNFLSEDFIDFTYSYNTNSLSREMDSTDIISKMFVKTITDSASPTGESSIALIDANKSKEDYLLNFDYFYKIGTISQEQYDAVKIFEEEIGKLNRQIESKNNTIIDKEKIIEKQKVIKATAEDEITAIDEQINTNQDAIAANSAATTEYTKNNPKTFMVVGNGDNNYINMLSNTLTSGGIQEPIALYNTYNKTNATLEHKLTFKKEYDDSKPPIIKKLTNIKNKGDIVESGKIIYATYKVDPNQYYSEVNELLLVEKNKAEGELAQAIQKISSAENDLTVLKEDLENLKKNKEEKIADFENLMGPALREGTWQPEDKYIDYGETVDLVGNITSSTNLVRENTDILSFGWDNITFEEEQTKSYLYGLERTEKFYPCLKLTNDMLEAINQADQTSFTYYDEIYGTLDGESDPRNEHKLVEGSGCTFAFLKPKTGSNRNVIPVLMMTQVTNLDDFSILQKPENNLVCSNEEEEFEAQIEVSSSDWLFNTSNYDIVYPRFQINSLFFNQESGFRIVNGNTTLNNYEDYYIGYDNQKYFITIRPSTFLKFGGMTQNYFAEVLLSNASLAIYLDALEVMKENSTPKVSYSIDPSVINSKFTHTAYNSLGQLAHINDPELKFENVMGYISEVDLNLDKYWEDKIIIKNYKTKFEDLFSSIVAQTEAMKSNSMLISNLSSLLDMSGQFSQQTFNDLLSTSNLNYLISQNAQILANQAATVAASHMAALSESTALRVLNGDIGLAFSSDEITKVELSKEKGLLIEGTVSTENNASKNVYFRVTNNAMGFFEKSQPTSNEPASNEPDKGLLYFENGDLALSGNIYAQNGWFGGENGWIIGRGLTDNDAGKLKYKNTSYQIISNKEDLGGLLYSANGKVIFAAGTADASPKIILSKNGFSANNSFNTIDLNDPTQNANALFVFDGNNLYINGTIAASQGVVGGWIINNNALWSPIYSKTDNINNNSVTTYFRHRISSDSGNSVSLFLGAPCNDKGQVSNVEQAPFYVTKEGRLHATEATISGIITASDGSIGGWSITNNSISKTATMEGKNYEIYMSSNVYSNNSIPYNPVFCVREGKNNLLFYVRSNGDLYAKNANITGIITATSGRIGGNTSSSGWTISENELQSSFTIGNKAAHMLIHTDDISITQETGLGTYSELKLSLNPYGITMTGKQQNETGFQHSIFSLHHIPATTTAAILSMFGKDVISYSSVENPIFYGNINNFDTKNLTINSSRELILQGRSIKIKIGDNTVKVLEIDGNGFVKAIDKQ